MNMTELKATVARWSPWIKGAGGLATFIGALFAGWFTLTATFASAEDFAEHLAMDATDNRIMQLESEQSVNELRIDVLEDRLDRDANSEDVVRQNRLNRQLRRLEDRNQNIQNLLDQMR